MKPLSDRQDCAQLTDPPRGPAAGTQTAWSVGRLPRLALAMSLLVLAAGCNSTDALTPQVDVGNGSFNSPPVTQNDLDGMSNEPPVTAGQQTTPRQTTGQTEQAITGQTLAPPSGQTTSLSQTATAGQNTYRDPAGTLEGQAAALGNGQTQPARQQPLAAQTTQQQPTAGQTTPQQTPTQQAQAQQTATQSAAVSPQAASVSVRFLPIIGAPVQAVTPLSRQLGTDARAKGITIKSASDASAEHMLKGYFSAFADGPNTTVTYVWDVLDGSGNRLNRIQGQATAPGGGADPWSSVPAATMQDIATRTIDTYLTWRNGRSP